jgi:hypothetical protein
MNFTTHRTLSLAVAAMGVVMQAAIQAQAAESPSPEARAFFREQVYPILKANCLKCHGGEKTKGGLEMTSQVALLKGGETGAAIDANAPEKSLLLEMISYKDKDHEMPPAGKRPPEEIAIIEKWVAMGAPYDPSLETAGAKKQSPHPEGKTAAAPQSWWAYQPVKKVAPPVVKNTAWNANPVDAFLASRLESAGLQPNAPATKEQLIRRAYYDLIGLPPAPAEVEKFVADHSADAWARLIEELLAKPQYGEKWARHWMDIVRYAETEGFERDSAKPNIWRYRDYLIDAFNSDLPYDRFITEQLAGDELEVPTQASLTATGFLRLGQYDDEPADRLLAKYDSLADTVQVTSEAFLGMTMGCARCHDHKKDPITQRDYYSFMSFFHGLKEYSATRHQMFHWLPKDQPEVASKLAKDQFETLQRIEAEEQRLRKLVEHDNDLQPGSGTRVNPADSDKKRNSAPTADGNGIEQTVKYTFKQPDSGWKDEGFDSSKWESEQGKASAQAGQQVWVRRTFALKEIPKFMALEFEYEGPTELFINGTQIFNNPNLPKGRRTLMFAPPILAKNLLHTGVNYVCIRTNARHADAIPEALVWDKKSDAPQLEDLLRRKSKEEIARINERTGGDFVKTVKHNTERWFTEVKRPLGIELSAASEAGVAPPPLAVHRRGNPQSLGEPVEAAFPVVLSLNAEAARAQANPVRNASSGRRTALANWLTRPENPLVSRVAVNRIWQHHFGRGIVPSSNDFGRLGELPTHPDLLDYLARKFIENKWSFKSMHRLVMTSQAYRMSSAAAQDGLEKDPENALLWRYPMRRLTAEELRDSILWASGLLKLNVHGEPVYPPLPEAVLATQSVPGRGWPRQDVEETARRSVYVHVKRTLSVPLLSDHDQAATDTPCAVRFASTVPTQALGMLNSEFMADQSRRFSERIRREAGNSPEAQIRHGLKLVLQREPSRDEVAICRRTIDTLKTEHHLSEETALQRFALLALNLNEFVYLD